MVVKKIRGKKGRGAMIFIGGQRAKSMKRISDGSNNLNTSKDGHLFFDILVWCTAV